MTQNIRFVWILLLVCGICVYCKGDEVMSILQQLWYGEVNPSENKTITDQETALLTKMSELQNMVTASLDDKSLHKFKEYLECSDEYASLMEAQAFEIGFKTAMLILT